MEFSDDEIPMSLQEQAKRVTELLDLKHPEAGHELKKLLRRMLAAEPTKPKGGAQKVRERKAREEHERQRQDKESGEEAPFARLRPAPLDNTAEMVLWANEVLALSVERAVRRRDIFPCEFDQLRFIADSCAKLGMIRDKASEQEKIKKALRHAEKQSDTEGLEDVRGRAATPQVSRPT